VITPRDGIVEKGTYVFRLTASKDGVTWDLTGATVTLILRRRGSSAVILAAPLVSASAGTAAYTTLTTDLAPGAWYLAWRVVQGAIDVTSESESFDVRPSLAAA
jgi:hypothetical protein